MAGTGKEHPKSTALTREAPHPESTGGYLWTGRVALFLIGMAALAAAGCAGARRTNGGPTMEYLETWRRLQAEGAPFPARSEAETRAIARFQELLADLKAPGLAERARAVYSPGAWFNDTLKTVRGAEAIGRYLAKTGAALESGTVEFLDVSGSDGDYYVRWQMTLRFARLDRGATHRSVGISHLRFDREGRVALHQDFWDSTSGLFEHLPGLGWLLRRVKGRL